MRTASRSFLFAEISAIWAAFAGWNQKQENIEEHRKQKQVALPDRGWPSGILTAAGARILGWNRPE